MPKTHYKPEKYAGPPKQEVIDTRNQYISPGVFTYYKGYNKIKHKNYNFI